MRFSIFAVLVATLFSGCSQDPIPESASSLLAVDDAAFVCARVTPGSTYVSQGVPLYECAEEADLSGYRLLALATQQETGEVAVLDATGCARPNDPGSQAACLMGIVDVEATVPGLTFLPVGAQPVSIRATPGGTATFVAVAEPGRTGIFALPTTCVGERPRGPAVEDREAVRDLRTWPACRLPVAPRTLELIRDTRDHALRCDGQADDPKQAERECPADLTKAESSGGRLKLVATLPELGQVWTFDAQEVLDREPGSYDDCKPEQKVLLSTQRPAELVQSVPDDLSSQSRTYSNLQGEWASTPTDIAADLNASHGQVYVADRSAPVIHQLDTRDACAIKEQEPLYPLSYTHPDAVIGTRKVALSPVIDSGKRYVYAVEESVERTSGSIMSFDVSPQTVQRTPLVLPRSPLNPSQPPDRIQYSQEVSDVDFVFRDPPAVDFETGVGATGVLCDPDPNIDPQSPAARFRPTSSGGGAGPTQLRGLFAFASLYAGFVSIIDVEDYDAPCRRPISVNPGDVPDTYGCADDPWNEPLETSTGPTVTDELSCHVVQPHRVRAGTLFNVDAGGVPRLSSFPRLRAEDGSSLLVDTSAQGRRNPHMLAVPQTNQVATIQIGGTEYSTENTVSGKLVVDPSVSENNSLLLPIEEPRAYPTGSGSVALTYEGLVRGNTIATLSVATAEQLSARSETAALPLARDYGVFYVGTAGQLCRSGIEDEKVMAERGPEMYPTANNEATDVDDYSTAFGRYYGDYAEILEDLKPADHPYWAAGGATCGEAWRSEELSGRRMCQLVFGDQADGQPERTFRIVRAFDDELVVEPRYYSNDTERAALLDLATCCFSESSRFIVRGSQHWVYRDGSSQNHPIVAGAESACVRDNSALRQRLNIRAFEVACDGEQCAGIGAPPASSDWVPVCVLSAGGDPPIAAGSAMEPCIYNTLTARFAVYRGQEPSARGMSFAWKISGGFVPFTLSMSGISSSGRGGTNPQRLKFVPELARVLVTDGAPPSGASATGMMLLGLDDRFGDSAITQSRIVTYY